MDPNRNAQIPLPAPSGPQHPLSTYTPAIQRTLDREAVMDFLDIALQTSAHQYRLRPTLALALRRHFQAGLKECNDRGLCEKQILVNYVAGERLIVNTHNRYQLLTERKPDQVVSNELASFPLRNAVLAEINCIFSQQILQPIVTKLSDLVPAVVLNTTKAKTGKASDTYDKLDGAPAANLDFPAINITLAEIAAFLPHAIKSWDVIDRFAGNGGNQGAYAKMVNHFRDMPRGEIKSNTVYRMMKGSVNRRAKEDSRYKGWTTGNHRDIQMATPLDKTSVSVAGFRTPWEGKVKTSAPSIPIRDLAKNVKVWPTDSDALDLTRAVKYCVDRPDEQLFYPDHVGMLIHLLGPRPVQPEHHDAAVLARYTPAIMAERATRMFGRKRDAHGRLLKAKSESNDEGVSEDADGSTDQEYLNSIKERGVTEDAPGSTDEEYVNNANKVNNTDSVSDDNGSDGDNITVQATKKRKVSSEDSGADGDANSNGSNAPTARAVKRRKVKASSRPARGSTSESSTRASRSQKSQQAGPVRTRAARPQNTAPVRQRSGTRSQSSTSGRSTRSTRFKKSYTIPSDSDDGD